MESVIEKDRSYIGGFEFYVSNLNVPDIHGPYQGAHQYFKFLSIQDNADQRQICLDRETNRPIER